MTDTARTKVAPVHATAPDGTAQKAEQGAVDKDRLITEMADRIGTLGVEMADIAGNVEDVAGRVADQAQKLSIQPWQVKIDGMVEKEITVDAEELIRKMPVEERLYRHRCVEAWSMAVPWSGFALSALVDYAKPLSGATYLQMQTFQKPEEAPGQRQFWYPWPYIEGLTMAEARNELDASGSNTP